MRLLTRLRATPDPLRSAAALALALLVGLLIQELRTAPDPSPSTLDEVRGVLGYLGESAAPYLLVPFAAGLLARTRLGAALIGVLTCWVLVAAYYGWFLPGSMLAMRGAPGEQAFWLVAAVAAGAIAGLLGRAAVRSRVARCVMPVALLIEPVGWLVLLRLRVAPVLAQPADVAGALVEAAVGAVWLVLTLRAGGRRRPSGMVQARTVEPETR